VSAVLDDHDGALLQFRTRMVQYVFEALNHEIGPRVAETKQHDVDDLAASGCQDFSEVQIELQDDSLFPTRLMKNLAVGQAL
jgi:hypothetical protein